jgi:hypothetical protein
MYKYDPFASIRNAKYRSSMPFGQIFTDYQKHCNDSPFYEDLLKRVDAL